MKASSPGKATIFPRGRLKSVACATLFSTALPGAIFICLPHHSQEDLRQLPHTWLMAYNSLPAFLKDLPKSITDPQKQVLFSQAEYQILEAENYSIRREYLKAHKAYEEAIGKISQAVGARAPITALFLMRQATFEDSFRKPAEAELCMRKALLGLPRTGHNKQVYLMASVSLGRLLQQQDKYPEALDVISGCLSLAQECDKENNKEHNNTKIVLRSLARCYIHDLQIEKATETCKAILGLSQTTPANKDDIATSLIDLGNVRSYPSCFDEAIHYYNEALRVQPKRIEAYIQRGKCYNSLHLYDQAISDFTQAIKIDSQNPAARQGRATAYEHNGHPEKAIEDLTVGIALSDDQSAMLYQRSHLYRAMGLKEPRTDKPEQ